MGSYDLRMRTTPPPPIDVLAAFPQVAPYAMTATRLHPRRGNPTAEQSSVGGPLLWPADEPWPTCGDVGFDDHPFEDVALVPVVQLFADDVPDLPFPDGADLLQVLWCPFDHDPWSAPAPQVRWRRRADVGARLTEQPAAHEEAPDHYLPDPCVVHPERVVEYPSYDLPAEVRDQIRTTVNRVEEETGWHYDYDLSVAPGIKVGGYPSWTQTPYWPTCGCGTGMVHLLTVASWELSRGDDRRWIPLEDRPAMEGWGFDSPDGHPWRAIQNPAGIMLGDVGGIYLFVCPSCPDRPFDHCFDCC